MIIRMKKKRNKGNRRTNLRPKSAFNVRRKAISRKIVLRRRISLKI